MSRLFWTTGLAALVLATAADAGIFSKKDKPAPAVQVVDLIRTLQNAPDPGKRADAAEELRQFDAASFPEIVPALIFALQNDSNSGVRKQAAESLGKIKPTSQEALQALEQAEKQDKSMLVRWRARTAQLGYRVAPPANTQAAPSPPPAAPKSPVVKIVPGTNKVVVQQPTQNLPRPPAPSATAELPKSRPAPAAPKTPVSTTTSGPILDPRAATPASLERPVPRPPAPPTEDGPILIPPGR